MQSRWGNFLSRWLSVGTALLLGGKLQAAVYQRQVDEISPQTFQHWRWVLLALAPGGDGYAYAREVEIYSEPAPEVNLAPAATVTVSSTSAGHPRHLNDGKERTFWRSGRLQGEEWIQLSFTIPIRVVRLVLVQYSETQWIYRYRLEGSLDGQQWTVVVAERRAYPQPPVGADNPDRLPLWVSKRGHARKLYGIYRHAVRRNWQEGRWFSPLRRDWLATSRQAARRLEPWAVSFALVAQAPVNARRTLGVLENFWRWVERPTQFTRSFPGYGLVPQALAPRQRLRDSALWASQTPLLAWAVWRAYTQTHDRRLLTRSFEPLILHHAWWLRERDVDADWLIEVGAYDGQPKTAQREAFAGKPTLREVQLTSRPREPTGKPWYGTVEPVEQTVFLLVMEQALARMAEVLGKGKTARRLRRLAAQRAWAVRLQMYEEETGFFYDLDRDSNRPLRVKCASGFLPLFAHLCTEEQAQRLVAHLQDPEEFWTPYPLPTVAIDEPAYCSDAPWSGDVRPEVNYLVASGLKHYGYFDLARRLTEATLRLVDENLCSERYDSQTGEPLGVCFHAASAAVLPLLYENEYGLWDDGETLRLDKRYWGREVRVGPLRVQYRRPEQVLVTTDFPRNFTLLLPPTWRVNRVAIDLWARRRLTPVPFQQDETSPNRVRFSAERSGTYWIRQRPRI
ncbi:MAG TPA: hypothetical protein EYP85_16415 [Armatimonadetes bacterium]|nr:hypothetical protein [Armatimonadota bacterium]